MVLTIILGLASAALATVIALKILKDSAKEEKLDKVATIIKAGVDALAEKMADGKLTAQEVGEVVTAIIKEAKEQF